MASWQGILLGAWVSRNVVVVQCSDLLMCPQWLSTIQWTYLAWLQAGRGTQWVWRYVACECPIVSFRICFGFVSMCGRPVVGVHFL